MVKGLLAYEAGHRRKHWIHHGSKAQCDEEEVEAEVASPILEARRPDDRVYKLRVQVRVPWIRNAMEMVVEMAP